MPSIRDDSSRGTQPRRSGSLARMLLVAIAFLAAGSGCGTIAPRAASPAAQKKEPYLVLKLSERRVYVMDDESGAPPVSYPVAIGKPQYPTPTGRFQINEQVENHDFLAFDIIHPNKKDRGRIPPGLNNPLGLRWIGFAYAHGWQVGFHGTAKTSVLGQAVSHGCVRMSNPDIVAMYSKLKLGTPVVVEP
jgi:L,D-transpeptidase ErfK/SrfK